MICPELQFHEHSHTSVSEDRRTFARAAMLCKMRFLCNETKESAMRCPIKEFLLSTVLLFALVLTGHAQAPTPTPTPTPAPTPTKTLRPVPNFVAVTDQTMRAPKPDDWLIHRGNYQGWG